MRLGLRLSWGRFWIASLGSASAFSPDLIELAELGLPNCNIGVVSVCACVCTYRFIMNKPNGYIMTTYSYHDTTVVFMSYIIFNLKTFSSSGMKTVVRASFVCIEAFNSSRTWDV